MIENQPTNVEVQRLKQSVLDMSQEKVNQKKEKYSFNKRLQQKLKNKQNSYDSNYQIDVLQGGEYLKLLCHQKKYLSQKRAQKIQELNQSLLLQQEDFKYMFMIATQAHYFKLQYPKYYERLLEQSLNYPKSMFSSIEKDINRTLINDHPFQCCLRNVLTTFAIRNPNLLYCQGMNYLVAYFLINSISQQQTFWILVSLVENVLPDDYFKDLTTISIVTQIFSDVLPYIFPDMAKQMKQVGMDTSLYIVSWYVCLFTKGFINSVSAYLLTKLILERRNHSLGYILLKLSLGVIAAILGRDQPFTFKAEFAAFRDKFQLSVFEISLLQIKLGVEYIELNEQNYLKLQKYYRDKRDQHQIQSIERDLRNKRLLLPICNASYPICLHRIQIERKIGNVQQVIINKNGFTIQSQYIEDYFDSQPKKEVSCIGNQTIEDCLLYRQNHICQLDLLNRANQINLKDSLAAKIPLRHDESFQMQLIAQNQLMQREDGQLSISLQRSFSKADQKFRELSGYFVVDQNFKFGSDQDIQIVPFQEQQQPIFKHQNIGSTTSIDQSFNLDRQLEKNQIKKDWLKSQTGLHVISQTKTQNQSKQSVPEKQQQNNVQKQNQFVQIQTKEQPKKMQQSNKSINSNQSQYNFFNKQKIWNFLGKTWRKVTKIKQEQLKN